MHIFWGLWRYPVRSFLLIENVLLIHSYLRSLIACRRLAIRCWFPPCGNPQKSRARIRISGLSITNTNIKMLSEIADFWEQRLSCWEYANSLYMMYTLERTVSGKPFQWNSHLALKCTSSLAHATCSIKTTETSFTSVHPENHCNASMRSSAVTL